MIQIIVSEVALFYVLDSDNCQNASMVKKYSESRLKYPA